MSYRVDKHVMVPMRDGVRLATDIWIPDGGPAPVLLARLPYGKDVPDMYGNPVTPNVFALVEAGYVVVWQDCRGTFRSEGDFVALMHERHDGLDTIAWLCEQPWCDGNVGMFGASYLGFVQWASAWQGPGGLKAIAPAITTTDLYRAPWYSEGGAVSWHAVWSWATGMAVADELRALNAGSGELETMTGLVEMLATPDPHLEALPIRAQQRVAEQWPWWSDWLDHPHRDQYWVDLAVVERLEQVTAPALHIGGWFDIFIGDTSRTFIKMQTQGGSAEAREGQRLVIGPWDHLSYTGAYRDRPFGLAADIAGIDITGTHIKFYDRWLRGRTDALDGVAPVRIFVMGIDQWRDEESWPLTDTQYVDYYLDSSGRANTVDGDGVLSTEPAPTAAVDSYLYDPNRPVPTLGGRVMMPATLNAVGPVDQRPAETRADVLCFTTPVVEQALEVTGPITLVLHVTSSAPDTDFTGKLVDVFPDERAIYLTDGILRARYRNSLAEPELLQPNDVYALTLDLAVTSNVFLPGHQIRLEVSSSNFPRYDRNTNTGGVIAAETPDQAVVAINRVLHGPEHPSRLILPIIRR